MSSSEGNILLGVVLAAIAACCLALAMSVQRYGLKVPPPVPFLFGSELPQFWVWFIGLMIYWVANGLFAASLIFAPLALLGGIFTTLLVWNLLFGRWLLGEKVTVIKCAGAVLIMLGVSLIGIATPSDIPTEYSASLVGELLKSSGGAAYIGTLTVIVLISIIIIGIFEHEYPLNNIQEQLPEQHEPELSDNISAKSNNLWVPGAETNDKRSQSVMFDNKRRGRNSIKTNRTRSMFESVTTSVQRKNTAVITDHLMRRQGFRKSIHSDCLDNISRKITIMYVPERNEMTPTWLDRTMGVIYPGSLGLDEGIGHLAMKAFMALLVSCGKHDECGKPILWGMIMIWLFSSLATLWWLQNVFRRYDVTLALPIEYGAVMACDALSAIIFYREYKYMEDWQLILVITGVVVVILGILIGRLDRQEKFVSKCGNCKDSLNSLQLSNVSKRNILI